MGTSAPVVKEHYVPRRQIKKEPLALPPGPKPAPIFVPVKERETVKVGGQ